MIAMIAAVAKNGVIGNNNDLPWRLKEDLKHFKKVTLNSVVIMGYNTYNSIKKPLVDRVNIVVTTKDINSNEGNLIFVKSPEEALLVAKIYNLDIFIIGGKQIYLYFLQMNIIERVYLTFVELEPAGDVKLDLNFTQHFVKVENSEVKEENQVKYVFEVWDRVLIV